MGELEQLMDLYLKIIELEDDTTIGSIRDELAELGDAISSVTERDETFSRKSSIGGNRNADF